MSAPCTPRATGRTTDEDVDEITVQLRDCSIRVRLSPGGRATGSPSGEAFSSAASSSGFSVVTEGVGARVPLAGGPTASARRSLRPLPHRNWTRWI